MTDKVYTTEAKIAAYLGGITITSGATSAFILAAQAFIDNYTGRSFKADSVASARKYDGNNRQYLLIDDCVAITKVEVGNNIWGDSFTEMVNTGSTPEYYLMPTNYSSEGLPINKIGLRNRIWINGMANHRITAKWGYSANVPDDISFSATVISSGMYYQNRGGKTGQIKSEKIGEYQVSYSDQEGLNDFKQALSMLDKYKKFEI